MSSRISLIPEPFAVGPLLSLVPVARTEGSSSLSSLRTLEVALFSRLEQLEKLTKETGGGHDLEQRIERERQMLKLALDWCTTSQQEEG